MKRLFTELLVALLALFALFLLYLDLAIADFGIIHYDFVATSEKGGMRLQRIPWGTADYIALAVVYAAHLFVLWAAWRLRKVLRPEPAPLSILPPPPGQPDSREN